jgi:hypothetical protein
MNRVPKLIERQAARRLGLRHYFTGKACKRGHVAERFTSTACCMACSREHAAAYAARNPKKMSDRQRRHYWRDPEAARAKQREKNKRHQQRTALAART